MRLSGVQIHRYYLRIDEIFTLQLVPAGTGIARKGDSRTRVGTEIAKDHGLNIARRANEGFDFVDFAVFNGPVRIPRAKDGLDASLELFKGVLWERLAVFIVDRQVRIAQFFELVTRKIHVVDDTSLGFQRLEFGFEIFVGKTQDNITKHVQEATVGIVSKAFVVGGNCQALDGLFVEALLSYGY
jgi:hypothetical protein